MRRVITIESILFTLLLGLTLAAAGPAAGLEDITDVRINRAVENQLLLDDAVPAHLIDVTTSDGIVTLSGSVDHLLARRRAGKIAAAIRGVRSVVNQVTIVPVIRTDEQIEEDVETALLEDPATRLYQVEVEVDGGTVILSGTVDSRARRDLSEEVAAGIRGVRDVENRISVEYPEERLDPEIEAEVERRLATDIHVNELLITVDVADGAVSLSGTVGSFSEKYRARRLAWVNGVTSVNDDTLTVEPWAKDEMLRETGTAVISDEEIRETINDALLHDPRVAAFEIGVEVDAGLAELTGTVDNLAAKRAAGEVARNTRGVWSVTNRIKVRPITELTDTEIAARLRGALARDVLLDRFEITVQVRNRMAFLSGTVNTRWERNRAEDLAARVEGVVEVSNQITVTEEWPWKSDRRIKSDIEDYLFWSPLVDEDRITVSVEEGVATLTGEVDSWREYNTALARAFAAGAREVNNLLTVSGVADFVQPPQYHYRDYLYPEYDPFDYRLW